MSVLDLHTLTQNSPFCNLIAKPAAAKF